MKKYKIFIEGKNVLIKIDDEVGKHGFFTTRFIKAGNTREAGNIALKLVREGIRVV